MDIILNLKYQVTGEIVDKKSTAFCYFDYFTYFMWLSQDLKDFMRQAGEVTYADAHKQRKNEG